MKKRWQLNRKRLGLPIDKPNLVMGAQVHGETEEGEGGGREEAAGELEGVVVSVLR